MFIQHGVSFFLVRTMVIINKDTEMDENTIKKLIGKRIKQLRKARGLTQFTLGEIIEVDQRQVAYIEGGNSFPSLKTLNKLSEAFDCSIKDLFDYEHLIAKENLQEAIEEKLQLADEKTLSMFYQFLKVFENHSN